MTTCTPTTLTTLTKQPDEVRLFGMDFSNKMVKNEVIMSVDSTESSPAGITFTGTTIDSQIVNILCTGGTEKKKYKITVKITTGTGQSLENEGYLDVVET